ncbi:Actin- protein 10 [Chytridiales sp. JEL 0842]|nr:Actin- protein 10 [Chytridiales sp. JEL 0842]
MVHLYKGFEDRVVLDIGSLYIKVGLSGEAKPRHIVPFTIPVIAANTPEASKSGNRLHGLYHLELDNGTAELRKNLLTQHLMLVYSKYLLADPKQRKVIVCENTLMPMPIKQLVADILFNTLKVPSVSFLPSAVLALFTSGKSTGLVIDCGHLETTVLPIYDGRPLIPLMQTIPLAGDSVTGRLKTLIKNHGSVINDSHPQFNTVDIPTTPPSPHVSVSDSIIESQSPEQWEDLKSRALFVGHYPTLNDLALESREGAANSVRDRTYPYTMYQSSATPVVWRLSGSGAAPADRVFVPGWVRERAAEILLEGDEDGNSVPSIVLDCLLKCPVDIRTVLAQNVMIVGGTSMLPGFQTRLLDDMIHLLQDNKKYAKIGQLGGKFKFIKTVFAPNCAAWIGGALKTAATEITRESFAEDPRLPDWSCFNGTAAESTFAPSA